MKRTHVLRVEDGPEVFEPLLQAVAAAGLRVGWLELAEPEPVPPTLARAAGAGALRAVAVGESGSVAVKARRGPAVLTDVLREHFLGCRLVLVRGESGAGEERAGGLPTGLPEAPRLIPVSGGAWRVEGPSRAVRDLSTDDLVARLRRPRPWQ